MSTKAKRNSDRAVSRQKNGAQPGLKSASSTMGKGKKMASRATSPVGIMREVLASNPNATVEQIETALKQRGQRKSIDTIRTIRSDFMGVYRALARAGALNNPVVSD